MENILKEWIYEIMKLIGLSDSVISAMDSWIILTLIVITALIIDWGIRSVLLRVVHKIVSRTKASWDDIIFEDKVLRRACNITMPILIYIMLPIAFPEHLEETHGLNIILKRGIEIFLVITVMRFINALFYALYELADHRQEWQGKPIKGLMQTGQVVTICISVILIVSILINKSPIILLTGLGASAAIVSLIFKDSILGLVAGVQLSANNMLKVGDWIYMPENGVDGVVEEVALTIVKVRQWDNTLAMLPPYLLISSSFSNWQAMRDSGGRRVKRSINIDFTSIKFATDEFITRLQSDERIAEIMREIEPRSAEGGILTNLDLFMRYMNRYIDRHARVNTNMITMVRQLQPTQWGLPIELYFFSSNVNWVPHEHLQSEVISHTVALSSLFELRIYQAPSCSEPQSDSNLPLLG